MYTEKNRQLPSSTVAKELGEVNVRKTTDGSLEILCTILMEPVGLEAEGWQTGVALDASASMKNWYGKELLGKMPVEVQEKYVAQGWITKKFEDGRETTRIAKEAYEDALKHGHLKMAPNIVEPQARDFVSYLAENLDADGGTTVIYWAGGSDGSECEVIGDYTAVECKQLSLSGPKSMKFGNGTRLLPAMKYFADRFRDAANGMYVFLTDGQLDDLNEVKQYSTMLAKEIAAKRRNPLKFVLIGIGSQIEESQMEELDDLETGTAVDLWDHKIAAEMRSVLEIFAEVVSENRFVGLTGEVLDDKGQQVCKYSDGVPTKLKFVLPAGSTGFELVVEGTRVKQQL